MEMSLDDKVLLASERLARGRRALLQARATADGLSSLQVDILALIASGQDSAATLSDRLDVAASTVADAVAALQRKGLVEGRADSMDGRRRRLALTGPGRAAAERQIEAVVPLRAALEDLPEQLKGDALMVLVRLVATLHAQGIVTVDRSCATCRFHQSDGTPAGFCGLLDRALLPETLRVECAEHEALPAAR